MQHTVTQDGEIVVVALRGEIDLEFSSSMRKVLLDSIAKGRGVVVDLSAVSMIDSSGVASLLEAFQTARKRGKKLILAATPVSVSRVLKLARLDAVFQMAGDIASAKRALG